MLQNPYCTFKKKAFIAALTCINFLFFIGAYAQDTTDITAGKANGVWWTNNNILGDVNAGFTADELAEQATTVTQIKNAYPATVGVFATVTWSSLAGHFNLDSSRPDYDWIHLDSALKSYSDSNLLIMLMIWAGPDCPNWIYDMNIMNVPKVITDDPNHSSFPYYLYKAISSGTYYNTGDSVYKREWYKMMDSVATHIKAYMGNLRKNVFVVQSAEGSTGDEGPYKGSYVTGTPNGYKIPRSSSEWIAFRRAAWKHQDTLYHIRIGIPIPPNTNYNKQIHLLVNCDPDDPEDTLNWVHNNVPNVWRKTNSVGHGYQFNNEMQKKIQFRPLVDTIYHSVLSADSATYARCRDEMDQYGTVNWQSIAPRQYNFYQAASALHFGLDIWPNTAAGLLNTSRYKKGFDFFNRYAGCKAPQVSPGGFCVLRDGLDAADTVRFPTSIYGSGTQDAADFAGMNRCRRIAAGSNFVTSGAKQDDSLHGQGEAINQLKATGLNDVGWNIFPGNYERWLTQIIDPVDKSKNGWGYWRIGTNDTANWYGRFAKGFRHGTSPPRDSMFFRIDDSLFRNTGANDTAKCTLHIAYYDTTTTPLKPISWSINYDAIGNATKRLMDIQNPGNHVWLEVFIPITDGRFKHNGPHGSDIVLVNVDTSNEIFSLVEVLKSQ